MSSWASLTQRTDTFFISIVQMIRSWIAPRHPTSYESPAERLDTKDEKLFLQFEEEGARLDATAKIIATSMKSPPVMYLGASDERHFSLEDRLPDATLPRTIPKPAPETHTTTSSYLRTRKSAKPFDTSPHTCSKTDVIDAMK